MLLFIGTNHYLGKFFTSKSFARTGTGGYYYKNLLTTMIFPQKKLRWKNHGRYFLHDVANDFPTSLLLKKGFVPAKSFPIRSSHRKLPIKQHEKRWNARRCPAANKIVAISWGKRKSYFTYATLPLRTNQAKNMIHKATQATFAVTERGNRFINRDIWLWKETLLV